MKLAAAVLLALSAASAQTTVYLRSSPPAAVQVMGATASGDLIIATGDPHTGNPINHNMNSGCGTSQTCYIVAAGLCANNGASIGNGVHQALVVDASHIKLLDINTGSPIAANGTYCSGNNGWGG